MSTQRKGRMGPPKGNTNARTHGLYSAKAALKDLGSRAIDKRTVTGKALAEWRNSIIEDLGGVENLSAQQQAVLDLAVRTKLLLDSVDAWLLAEPSLVNKRKRSLIPAIGQRVSLADSLERYLSRLGLERKERPAQDLNAYLRERSATAQRTETTSEPAATSQAQREPQEPTPQPTQPRDRVKGQFVEVTE